MKHEMYAIYDSQAKCFRTPFFAKTKGLAIRMFSEAVNTPESELNKHSLDFSLHKTGTFEDDSGSLVPETHGPVKTITASELLEDPIPQSPGGTI